jgi:RNA polymerase sigma-70 factor (family 1)
LTELLLIKEKYLLHLAAEGDESAFTELYNSYKDKLYSFSLKLTKSTVQAEDFVQDTFLKLWRDKETLKQIENLDGYIFKIIKNQALNNFKHIAIEHLVLKHIQKAPILYSLDAEEKITAKEMQQIIEDAINQLSPKQKQVFLLSKKEGFKQNDIASNLNISVSTVKNHIAQAMQQIKDYVKLRHGAVSTIILTAATILQLMLVKQNCNLGFL